MVTQFNVIDISLFKLENVFFSVEFSEKYPLIHLRRCDWLVSWHEGVCALVLCHSFNIMFLTISHQKHKKQTTNPCLF